MNTHRKTIRPRERDAIIQALAAGVVPRIGLPHIQVGRVREIEAMLRDIDRIVNGGAAIRFVIGEYGAGKTFFASLVRLIALERKCVTLHVDLSPNRRIQASGGQARALYSEAVNNLATRNKPDGGALQSVVERLVADVAREAGEKNVPVERIMEEKLASITDHSGGYDFATVLNAFWRGWEDGNEPLKLNALRWLRGEYATRTDARRDLGVRTIIDDANVYDSLKSLGCLVRAAGYSGLLVVFDEMANIYKLQNAQARKLNYEQILSILNDVLQGTISGLGFVMCGTPEFLTDTRRGLYSYEALQSRLVENTFAVGGLVDLSGPVLRLQNLTPEDLLVLLGNIRLVFANGEKSQLPVPDEALTAFMGRCKGEIGEAYYRTPRNTVRAFVQMLAVLEQNPGARWQDLLNQVAVVPDVDGANTASPTGGEDELATLRLGS